MRHSEKNSWQILIKFEPQEEAISHKVPQRKNSFMGMDG